MSMEQTNVCTYLWIAGLFGTVMGCSVRPVCDATGVGGRAWWGPVDMDDIGFISSRRARKMPECFTEIGLNSELQVEGRDPTTKQGSASVMYCNSHGLKNSPGQISHCKGGARRRRAAQRPRVLRACQNEAAKGSHRRL